MEQIRNFGDKRQMASCVYCGLSTESRDHMPPKVFLDEPYPTNLHIVLACQKCNNDYSLDEEYVACLLECILEGVGKAKEITRRKIKRILIQKPSLASRIFRTRVETGTGALFKLETERVERVVLKLARGHAAYELNEPQFGNPSKVTFVPLLSLAPRDLKYFETLPKQRLLPEVGSRAMQRMIVRNDSVISTWTVVQPGRYRYLIIANVSVSVLIRIVINEYLACEVLWE